MKPFLILVAGLTSFFFACGQTNLKLFGYVQPVLPGIIPQNVTDEEGNPIKRNTEIGYKYFIYIESSSKNRIYPISVFIKGEHFAGKAEVINETPVQIINKIIPSNPKTITLVPKTTKWVTRISPVSAAAATKTAEEARILAQKNELVVTFKLDGKVQTLTLKSLTELDPEANE